MRIKSSFQDYYDGCQFMCSEDIYYDRSEMNDRTLVNFSGITTYEEGQVYFDLINNEVTNELRKLSVHNRRNEDYVALGFIIIGIKLISFYSEVKVNKSYVKESEVIHYEPSSNIKISSIHATGIKRWLDKDFTQVYQQIRKITDKPIVVFRNDANSSYGEYTSRWNINRTWVTNCRLKDYAVSKILSPQEVLQEISLYLNKLKSTEIISDLGNENKILSAGFDLKTSFRK